MKTALKQLVDDLDNVFEEHEELGDTDVREQMYEAISKSFIVPQAGYVLPAEFGMFSDDGNKKVQSQPSEIFLHHGQHRRPRLGGVSGHQRQVWRRAHFRRVFWVCRQAITNSLIIRRSH